MNRYSNSPEALWVAVGLLVVVLIAILLGFGNNSRIDDQRFLAEQRRRWRNHEPIHRSPATRFLDVLGWIGRRLM